MLLRNYFAWMYSQRETGSNSTFPTTIKDLSGTVQTICHANGQAALLPYTYGHNTFSLHFGLSDTPSDRDQYCMNNDIGVDNYVSINTQNCTTNNNLDSIEYVFMATLVNNTSEPQIIKEAGITKLLYYGYGYNTSFSSLIAHEVLSEPITIPANGAKTVKYIWTIS